MFGRSTQRRLPSVALTLLLLCLPLSALAFVPVDGNSDYEIPLPAVDFNSQSWDRDVAALESTRTLQLRYGGAWRVDSWNQAAGTPHFVYGQAPTLRSAIDDVFTLESVSRQVIADNADILHADLEQMRLSATPRAMGKWAAHYQQTYHGLDVWQAKVRLVFSESGKLMLMGSDYYDDITLDPNPTLSAAQAKDLASSALPFDPSLDSVEEEAALLVLPVNDGASAVHHLVWRVRVHCAEPFGIWVTHVDAHSGEIVWRYNDIHFAYGGDSVSEVQQDTWCNGVSEQAMPYLRVEVSGVGTVYTDANGDWEIAGSGGSHSVTVDLYGNYIDIWNTAGAQAEFTGTVYDGTPLTVSFDDLEARHDERDVFDGINDVHDFFQRFAPEFGYVHGRIIGFVGRTTSPCPCNAWWNGQINFCVASGSCANTGEIQNIVVHEYGHGIQAAILGWQGDQGLGEGNADTNAIWISQESICARGFWVGNCETGIRDADNDLIYPDDVIGVEIHAAGQVISGFHWMSLLALQDAFGDDQGLVMAAERWHYGRVLLHPTVQPDQVLATFTADDDDGDLANGTPNYGAFCPGAMHHGFDCPYISVGVLVDHNPLGATDDTVNDYEVTASITSTYDVIDEETVKIFWRIDGSDWTEEAMLPGGMGGNFTGAIPAQDPGMIDYYIYAEDVTGAVGTSPYGAPAGSHEFMVASLFDRIEVIGNWEVGDAWDSATSGIWEHADPVGTIAQPEDDHSVAGSMCFITGQHTPGEADDFGDVDGGRTTLRSPIFDVSSSSQVTVRYWRWYSNHMAANANDTWKVQVSNNGGLGWASTTVENTQNSANEWKVITIELTDFFPDQSPDQLRLRFQAADIGAETLVEAAVDDFMILADLGLTGADDGLSVTLPAILNQNSPNPFNPVTEISFSLDTAGAARLAVYDVGGRLVKELHSGNLAAGQHTLSWNGRDEAGSPVASGVYLYRLEAAGKVMTRRMALVK